MLAKFYIIQYNQSLVSIRTFHPTTGLSDRRNRNACDSHFDAKSTATDDIFALAGSCWTKS